jgi:hypothetical protein
MRKSGSSVLYDRALFERWANATFPSGALNLVNLLSFEAIPNFARGSSLEESDTSRSATLPAQDWCIPLTPKFRQACRSEHAEHRITRNAGPTSPFCWNQTNLLPYSFGITKHCHLRAGKQFAVRITTANCGQERGTFCLTVRACGVSNGLRRNFPRASFLAQER